MPDKFKALATVYVFKSIAPPELTVTVPVPKAPLVIEPVEDIPTFIIPVEIVVPPV